ncbi:MAG: hypothetical protein ACOX0E_03780 [Syntrophomonadaceae bacterium]
MQVLKNSICYRCLAGSWIFGWLVAAPEKSSFYENSITFRLIERMVSRVVILLHSIGKLVMAWQRGSVLAREPLKTLGGFIMAIFSLTLVFDVLQGQPVVNDLLLVVLGLLILAERRYRQYLRHSLIMKTINWWNRTD